MQLNQSIIILSVVAILSYVGYQLIYGDRGIIVSVNLTKEITLQQNKLSMIIEQNKLLHHKINALQETTQNIDYIEELAKKYFNVTLPNEYIIVLKKSD